MQSLGLVKLAVVSPFEQLHAPGNLKTTSTRQLAILFRPTFDIRIIEGDVEAYHHTSKLQDGKLTSDGGVH